MNIHLQGWQIIQSIISIFTPAQSGNRILNRPNKIQHATKKYLFFDNIFLNVFLTEWRPALHVPYDQLPAGDRQVQRRETALILYISIYPNS